MSSLAWIKLGKIASSIVSSAPIVRFIEKNRAGLSPYAALERCLDRLEYIESLIQGILPERRRKIQIAAERRLCMYLTDIELELARYIPLNFISSL